MCVCVRRDGTERKEMRVHEGSCDDLVEGDGELDIRGNLCSVRWLRYFGYDGFKMTSERHASRNE